MKTRIPFHPPLIAAFPVLSLYSANMALVPLGDLWRPLAISIALSIFVWGVVGLVFRNVARGAAIASASMAGVFLYGRIVGPPSNTTPMLELGLYVLLASLLLFVFGRRWKQGDWQTPTLNLLGSALVLVTLASIVFGVAAENRHIAEIAHRKNASDSVVWRNVPDVFYILVDGYGRQDQLKRVFGYDNSAFVAELEKRGFFVANKSHSNYCQTELSLASSLNAELVQSLLPRMVVTDADRAPLDDLVNDSFVANTFKSHGYRTFAVTSGFPAFQMTKADEWLHSPIKTTLFEDAVLQLTPFGSVNGLGGSSMFDQRRQYLLGAFDNLQALARPSSTPRFVFAHILMPHPPFVLGADGTPAQTHHPFGFWDGSHFYEYGGTRAEYKSGYVGQVEYLNSRLLSIVDAIQGDAKTPPIILIQGDHGSKLGLDQERLDRTDIEECFGNLSALNVPDSVRKQLDDAITPVNSFRLILSDLFGAGLQRLQDKSWYSSFSTPYQFVDVTRRLAH